MKIERQKKLWKTPKLIVLVRDDPGFRVLTACKSPGQSTSPRGLNTGCYTTLTAVKCTACSAVAKS
jgi:hypothetical protein